ncbi:hypothetical protein EDC96DRAFT_540089 [Choanephora cucurbitarum]|nr:hypothetical protein EDC96DRAFT_540089 [Choanephora cucurbitarum]
MYYCNANTGYKDQANNFNNTQTKRKLCKRARQNSYLAKTINELHLDFNIVLYASIEKKMSPVTLRTLFIKRHFLSNGRAYLEAHLVYLFWFSRYVLQIMLLGLLQIISDASKVTRNVKVVNTFRTDNLSYAWRCFPL